MLYPSVILNCFYARYMKGTFVCKTQHSRPLHMLDRHFVKFVKICRMHPNVLHALQVGATPLPSAPEADAPVAAAAQQQQQGPVSVTFTVLEPEQQQLLGMVPAQDAGGSSLPATHAPASHLQPVSNAPDAASDAKLVLVAVTLTVADEDTSSQSAASYHTAHAYSSTTSLTGLDSDPAAKLTSPPASASHEGQADMAGSPDQVPEEDGVVVHPQVCLHWPKYSAESHLPFITSLSLHPLPAWLIPQGHHFVSHGGHGVHLVGCAEPACMQDRRCSNVSLRHAVFWLCVWQLLWLTVGFAGCRQVAVGTTPEAPVDPPTVSMRQASTHKNSLMLMLLFSP